MWRGVAGWGVGVTLSVHSPPSYFPLAHRNKNGAHLVKHVRSKACQQLVKHVSSKACQQLVKHVSGKACQPLVKQKKKRRTPRRRRRWRERGEKARFRRETLAPKYPCL
jgi:hypothetical protein